jgi:hypothetical protein
MKSKILQQNTREYTDSEMLVRIWAREDVQTVMAKRAYAQMNNERAKELDTLWVTDPAYTATASYGKTWGFYVGMDNIRRYYVDGFDTHLQQQLDYVCAADPTVENRPENLGIGTTQAHPLSTPLIEIAEDGKTAKGLFYSIGQKTEITEAGTANAFWIAQKIGVDFVLETDGWKIWHLSEIYDVVNTDGEDYKNTPYIYPDGHPLRAEFGTPNIEMLTHDERFNWWDNYPPEPMPYVTMTDDISYGPEGHPDYQ